MVFCDGETEIHVLTGSKVLYMSLMSEVPDEEEVLLNNNLGEYMVTSIGRHKQQKKINIILIPK